MKAIVGANNYDPMVGNKLLGNTMPLPKKNNLLESNRIGKEEDTCEKFLAKLKETEEVHKKPVRDK